MSEELKDEIRNKAFAAGRQYQKQGNICRPFNSTRYQALIQQYPTHESMIFQAFVDGHEGNFSNLPRKLYDDQQ